ncbi:MFS transporter [Sporolactobacillus sp. CQH2019]|uniref:MFS transporter n=1 Tax=Sporolactobacillus sp. CQH2019 TaxID=3023512 RepID=UPI0023675CE2|nr:MFS transporter [Sporolactobacillus sp. CQH2019]MDD9150621.1 MFS transporter [Sporolactobacillus sp. CQH2019]
MHSSVKKIFGFGAGTLAFVMAILDTTVVNIVLPDIMNDLNSSVSTVSWLLNAYNMAFAVLLLSAARLADQFGRKRVFLLGIILFTVSSLLCGFSSDIGWLIGFRLLQGAGAAVLVPVSIPILLSLFRKERQTLIIAIWGACSALASACGPVIGGLLANYGSWHDVFFVNIPFGFLAFVLTVFFVRESYNPSARRKIDWPGMLVLSAAIASLTFYLIKGNDYGWKNPSMLFLPAACAAALTLFLIIERKSQAPMLPFTLFKNRTFRCSNCVILLIGIAINAIMFICSLYLTRLRGLSILHAGYLLSALPIGTMILSIICSRLIKKIAPAVLLAVATCIIGISALLMSQFTADTPYPTIISVLLLSGCGFGINLPVIMNLIIGGVPGGNINMASGFANMARTLGGIVGVALIVAVLTGSLQGSSDQLKYDAIKKVDHDAVLLPSIKNAIKSTIKAIKMNASTSGSVSSNISQLRSSINRKITLTRSEEAKQLNREINRQAALKWTAIEQTFKDRKQALQRLPDSAKRSTLLTQLNTEEQAAAQNFIQQKAAMNQQAVAALDTKLDRQRSELLYLINWVQSQTNKNTEQAFSASFDAIAAITFAVFLFCPFLKRWQPEKPMNQPMLAKK